MTNIGIVGMTPLLMIVPGASATVGSDIVPSRMDYDQQKTLRGAYLVAVRTEDEAEVKRAGTLSEQAGGQEVEVFRPTKELT